jgi:hypothetical protein
MMGAGEGILIFLREFEATGVGHIMVALRSMNAGNVSPLLIEPGAQSYLVGLGIQKWRKVCSGCPSIQKYGGGSPFRFHRPAFI